MNPKGLFNRLNDIMFGFWVNSAIKVFCASAKHQAGADVVPGQTPTEVVVKQKDDVAERLKKTDCQENKFLLGILTNVVWLI